MLKKEKRQAIKLASKLTLASAFWIPSQASAQANPYHIGMEYCRMVQSGIDRDKAWEYIVENLASGAVNNSFTQGDPYAPWSPQRTLGGSLGYGVGTGIAQGISVGIQLKRMKPDIERVISSNCPAGGRENYKEASPKTSNVSTDTIPIIEKESIKKWNSPGVLGFHYDCTTDNQGRAKECRIKSLVRGLPAQKDGRIRVGDKFTQINGRAVAGLTAQDLQNLLGGPVGSYKTLIILTNTGEIPVTLISADPNI